MTSPGSFGIAISQPTSVTMTQNALTNIPVTTPINSGVPGGMVSGQQLYQQQVAPPNLVTGAKLLGMGAASDGWTGAGGSFVGNPNVGIHIVNGEGGVPMNSAGGIPGVPTVTPVIPTGSSGALTTPIIDVQHLRSIAPYQNGVRSGPTDLQFQMAVDAYSHGRPDLAGGISQEQINSWRSGPTASDIIAANQRANDLNTLSNYNTLVTSAGNMKAGPINGLANTGISPWLFPTIDFQNKTISPNYTGIDKTGNPINPTINYQVLTGSAPTTSILTQSQINDIYTQEKGSPTKLNAPSWFAPSGYEALFYLQNKGTIQSPVQNPVITQLGNQGLNINQAGLNNIWTQEKGSPKPLTAPSGWTPLTTDVKNYLATGFINQSHPNLNAPVPGVKQVGPVAYVDYPPVSQPRYSRDDLPFTPPVANIGSFLSASAASIQKGIAQPQITIPPVNIPSTNNIMPANIPQVTNQNMNMSGIQGSPVVNMRNMLGLDQVWW